MRSARTLPPPVAITATRVSESRVNAWMLSTSGVRSAEKVLLLLLLLLLLLAVRCGACGGEELAIAASCLDRKDSRRRDGTTNALLYIVGSGQRLRLTVGGPAGAVAAIGAI
eukprot:COSAG05_NODE_6832_length_894_cov_1.788679_2_plen_112_part_00